jgi:hypothetical protein
MERLEWLKMTLDSYKWQARVEKQLIGESRLETLQKIIDLQQEINTIEYPTEEEFYADSIAFDKAWDETGIEDIEQ